MEYKLIKKNFDERDNFYVYIHDIFYAFNISRKKNAFNISSIN